MLTPKDIEDFRRLIKEAFGRDLSIEEATVIATRYLELLDVIARPLPRTDSLSPDVPPAKHPGV